MSQVGVEVAGVLMEGDILTVWGLAHILMRAVPGIYLFMAIYIGTFGKRTRRNLAYIILFGTFGASCYMVLNQPAYTWFPIWFTSVNWLIVALLGLLMIGVVTFLMTIEAEDVESPWVVLCHYYERIRETHSDTTHDK